MPNHHVTAKPGIAVMRKCFTLVVVLRRRRRANLAAKSKAPKGQVVVLRSRIDFASQSFRPDTGTKFWTISITASASLFALSTKRHALSPPEFLRTACTIFISYFQSGFELNLGVDNSGAINSAVK
jgi:hypothetical protein